MWDSEPEPYEHVHDLGCIFAFDKWVAYEDATYKAIIDRYNNAKSSAQFEDDSELLIVRQFE